jgi:hypothetical protein
MKAIEFNFTKNDFKFCVLDGQANTSNNYREKFGGDIKSILL